MVNRSVIGAKLSELAMRIGRVRAHAKSDATALAQDLDALDLVAFNLMVAVQICADIASHVIADAGWPSARTLAESFLRLREHAVINETTALALGRAAGLRNVVAHGYGAVDPALVHAAATEGVRDLERFATEVAAWIAMQPRS